MLAESEYETIAKKSIATHGGGNVSRLMKDPEALGHIKYRVMVADWTFDASLDHDKDQKRQRYAETAVQKCIRRYRRLPNSLVKSNIIDNDFEVEDKTNTPRRTELVDAISKLDKKYSSILMAIYFENESWSSIAKRFRICTRMAQRRHKKAIEELRRVWTKSHA